MSKRISQVTRQLKRSSGRMDLRLREFGRNGGRKSSFEQGGKLGQLLACNRRTKMKTTVDPLLFTRIALFVLTSTALATRVQAQVPRLYSFYGDRHNETLGTSVRGAGDVNQDGYDDVIIGATDGNGASTEAGEAHVFSGRDGSLLYTFQAQEPGTAFGAAVGGAGDVNADGYADLVVGARYDDTSAIFAGAVYLFSGRDGKLLHAFFGDSEGDRLGND